MARDLSVCGSVSIRVRENMFEVSNWQLVFFFFSLWDRNPFSVTPVWRWKWVLGAKFQADPEFSVESKMPIRFNIGWAKLSFTSVLLVLLPPCLYYSAVAVGCKGNPACLAMSSLFPYPHPLLTALVFIPPVIPGKDRTFSSRPPFHFFLRRISFPFFFQVATLHGMLCLEEVILNFIPETCYQCHHFAQSENRYPGFHLSVSLSLSTCPSPCEGN